MSDVTDMVADTVARMLDLDTVRVANADLERGEQPAVWQQLDELGLERIMLTEAEGGAECGWDEMCEAAMALAATGCPTRLGEEMVARALCAEFGLPQPDGRLTFAIADSDLEFEHGKASGKLTRVAWGRTVHATLTVIGDQPVVVPIGSGPVHEATNLGHDFRDTLKLDGVAVQEGKSSESAAQMLECAGSLLRAAQIAGAANYVVDITLDYALQRKQFDKPLVAFQAIQQQIARMAEEALAATVATRSAFAAAGTSEAGSWAAVAKTRTADASKSVCEISHQVHGAIGFTMEHHLRYFTQRMTAWRNEFGSPELWAERLWDATCGDGHDGAWHRIVEVGAALSPPAE